MSLIGTTPLALPDNVNLTVDGPRLQIQGPLGTLTHRLPREIKMIQTDRVLTFERKSNLPAHRALHGLTRALVANMVEGVTKGFEKRLELVGTGYRVSQAGDKLNITAGFSHPVEVTASSGVSFTTEGNNKITVKGIDKYAVGQAAANIRKIRPPEPYKGKGIRYEGEVVRRKAGKAAKVGA